MIEVYALEGNKPGTLVQVLSQDLFATAGVQTSSIK